jgi:hypothetical protein
VRGRSLLRFFQPRSAQPPRLAPATEYNSYCKVDGARELRQAEILSDLTYYSIAPTSDDPGVLETTSATISHAIIMTPDCDLLQDYKARQRHQPARWLFSTLLFGVEEATDTRARMQYGRQEWKHVTNNEMERFHFLASIKPYDDVLERGLPDLVVDFKRYFTLPPGEIYRQCGLEEPTRACRRCRLTDLWREDLQRRAMSYMQRVGLPDPSDLEG